MPRRHPFNPQNTMTTELFTDTELICFDYDIINTIRKIKNQHQRADINSIHKKIIKIPDYHMFSENSSIFELKIF